MQSGLPNHIPKIKVLVIILLHFLIIHNQIQLLFVDYMITYSHGSNKLFIID